MEGDYRRTKRFIKQTAIEQKKSHFLGVVVLRDSMKMTAELKMKIPPKARLSKNPVRGEPVSEQPTLHNTQSALDGSEGQGVKMDMHICEPALVQCLVFS